MFFGSTSFSASPFASPGGVNIFVTPTGTSIVTRTGTVTIAAKATVNVTGEEIIIRVGNVTVKLGKTVSVAGIELALANAGVDVISWTPIPPGATQVWVPIDPNDP